MQRNNYKIALISETHLKPNNKFTLTNFKIYRTDRTNRPGGGTAIIIDKHIKHVEILLPTLTRVEATAIKLELNGSHTTLISAYNPPGNIDTRDIDKLLLTSNKVVIAGDLNSKHTRWGCRHTNSSGGILYRYIESNNAVLLAPTEPTHLSSRNTEDILDLAVAKGLTVSPQLHVDRDLNSDHYPVIMAVAGNPISKEPRQVLNYRLADWDLFRQRVDSSLSDSDEVLSPQDIDTAVSKLTAAIQDATKAAVPIKCQPRHHTCIPRHILALIKRRNRLRRALQQGLNRCIPRTKLNRLKRQIKIELNEFRAEGFQAELASLDVDEKPVWPLVKHFTREPMCYPPLIGPHGQVGDPDDKVNLFADTLEQAFQPNTQPSDPVFTDTVENNTLQFAYSPHKQPIHKTNLTEVKWAISNTKARKAPGPDTIGNTTLKNLSEKALRFFTNICNAILHTQHFPAVWKEAKILVFPKPGKDKHRPESYRPISLLNTMSKVFEKIVLKRINEHIHAHNILRPEQFGFRTKHSTTLQLLRVVEYATRGFNDNQSTGSVFLDIEKAFDRVWHSGLIDKLRQYNFPDGLIHLIRSYLADRYFRVDVDQTTSTQRTIRAGVPQGSLIGPVLFNIYINDIPTLDNTNVAIYADDTALSAQSWQPFMIFSRLQNSLTNIEPWLRAWRVKVNVSKCQALLLSKRQTHTINTPLRLFGEDIHWQSQVKYLGVILDRKLTWSAHISHTIKRANMTLSQLYPLLNKTSSLELRTATTIYLSVLRSVITYAAPVWGHTHAQTTNIPKQGFENNH